MVCFCNVIAKKRDLKKWIKIIRSIVMSLLFNSMNIFNCEVFNKLVLRLHRVNYWFIW